MMTSTQFAMFVFGFLIVSVDGRYRSADTSATSSKFGFAWHNEDGSEVWCRAVTVPIAHQYVSCTEQGKNDRFEKCPPGMYQPDVATSSEFEPLCINRWEKCQKSKYDEHIEIFSNCTLENHPCFDDGRCSRKNGFCGTDCSQCRRIPEDCPSDRANQDCTCAAAAPTIEIMTTYSIPQPVPEEPTISREETDLPNNTISKQNTSLSSGNDSTDPEIKDNEVNKAVYPRGKKSQIEIEGPEGWITGLISLGISFVLIWIAVAVLYWKCFRNVDNAQPRVHLATCSSINDTPGDCDTDSILVVQEPVRPIAAVSPIQVHAAMGNEEEMEALLPDNLPVENEGRTPISLAPSLSVNSLLNSNHHSYV